MKRLLSVLLVLTICLCFAACGGAGTGEDASEAQPNDVTAAAPAADNNEADVTEAEAPAEEAEAPADIAGEYYPFAMERNGYCVASPDFGGDKDGMITLNEDGTGSMLTGDITNNLKWTQDGDAILLTDESGLIPIPATVKLLSDGVFTMVYEDVEGVTYFAKLTADTSAIETISVEEYQAISGQ